MAKINPGQFMREVRQEGAKVTWPTRKETLVTTGMVFVMVFLMVFLAAIFFFLVDLILAGAIRQILNFGG
jgi:preprotein translocase subunit SecE